MIFSLSFAGGVQILGGGPSPLADLDWGGPYQLVDLDRGGPYQLVDLDWGGSISTCGFGPGVQI